MARSDNGWKRTMKLIGIAGSNGSGKDTVAHMLAEKYGFYFASATDMLGDELTRRGLPHERENKRNVSAEWRREHGLGVIVDKGIAAAQAAGYDKVVVGSLRNSGESDRVHELGGEVVWIDSDPKIRYERITKNTRGRVEDNKTFEQFLAEEQAEMQHSGDAATLNVAGVKAAADRFIYNDSASIDEFKLAAEAVLKDLL
ncbi:MAG: AAA family ATPase [Candidatus Saccharimonadales bacterium]